MSKPTIATLLNEIAMLKERVATLEARERTARTPGAPKQLGLPIDARKRFFAANPNLKTASPADIEKWLRTTGAQ